MMRAMVLENANQKLKLMNVPIPQPTDHEVQIEVSACGICRTDLHILDAELTHPKLPLIPGHQIVGTITKLGNAVSNLKVGQRVGVPWLGNTCGKCYFCINHNENLCENPRFTGYQYNGGFAEYCVADENFCLNIPEQYPDIQAAPLLCAGLIGYRAWLKANNPQTLGIYGFGAAAHILLQVANFRNCKVYAFTRPNDKETQKFALELGAVWAGSSDANSEILLDAAIIFASDGKLVPQALGNIRKGGIVVCGGIHMSDIPSFPYDLLWGERTICSVANLTRRDGEEFLELAPKIPIKTHVTTYSLVQTNEALDDLRRGGIKGAIVIDVTK